MPSIAPLSTDPVQPVRAAPEAAAVEPARPGRAGEIRSTLQDEIESGRLPPGAALDERALAARFGVSRTPVREALQQLAARDLVRIAPRQGVSVARLSVARLRSVMEAIGEMECAVARLAARRSNDALRRALDDALAGCQNALVANDSAGYTQANTEFHEAIYAGCRNEFLAEQIRAARRMVQRYRSSDFHTPAQMNRSLQEHLRLARAIQAGDETLAAQAMLAHAGAGSSGFSEFLATVPPSFLEPDGGG